jgi:hypothetical protein
MLACKPLCCSARVDAPSQARPAGSLAEPSWHRSKRSAATPARRLCASRRQPDRAQSAQRCRNGLHACVAEAGRRRALDVLVIRDCFRPHRFGVDINGRPVLVEIDQHDRQCVQFDGARRLRRLQFPGCSFRCLLADGRDIGGIIERLAGCCNLCGNSRGSGRRGWGIWRPWRDQRIGRCPARLNAATERQRTRRPSGCRLASSAKYDVVQDGQAIIANQGPRRVSATLGPIR